MKRYIHTKILFTGLFTLLLALSYTSCNEDDNGGVPVIYHVRTTDPELIDSTFVKGTREQMLVIEGENLGSARKVYINDQDVYFNPNYVTSKTIIVTIPEDLELTGTNPDLSKEIRVETSGGIATYSFHVLSPAPDITTFVAQYPINTGDHFLILGENFYEIEKIVLEGNEGNKVEAKDYVVSTNYKIITIKLPAGVDEIGQLMLHCSAGKDSIPYSTFVLPPTITSFSSDMPIVGVEFFITGTYFVDVEKVNINGEYDILADDLRVSATNDTIYLKLPSEPAVSGAITITAAGGDTNDNKMFYPIEYVMLDYDKVGGYSWGEGKVIEGNGQNPPYITTGKAGGIIEENVGSWIYWFGNLINYTEYTNYIADNVQVSGLAVRFECFVAYPLETIIFQIGFGNHWTAIDGYVPKSMKTGKTEIGKWMSCEIPLSELALGAQRYADVKAMNKELGIRSLNPADNPMAKYEIFFDNFRIVPRNGYVNLQK